MNIDYGVILLPNFEIVNRLKLCCRLFFKIIYLQYLSRNRWGDEAASAVAKRVLAAGLAYGRKLGTHSLRSGCTRFLPRPLRGRVQPTSPFKY